MKDRWLERLVGGDENNIKKEIHKNKGVRTTKVEKKLEIITIKKRCRNGIERRKVHKPN